MISRKDGTIVSQNARARRLMGAGAGSRCQGVVGASLDGDGDNEIPCSDGCISELLTAGLDQPQNRRVSVEGRCHRLTCIPLDDVIVSVLTANAETAPTRWQVLTPRETEVLRLLAEGENIPSVATSLGITDSTVRTHVEHMREKLGANTQAALVAVGFLLGYLG
ncbi:MAG: helix-turn-helix transcriptional regulator [bacterium]|nr:helix-turn-helix transcriptional regulator [bacterium]